MSSALPPPHKRPCPTGLSSPSDPGPPAPSCSSTPLTLLRKPGVLLHATDNFNKREYVVRVLVKVVDQITADDAVCVMQVRESEPQGSPPCSLVGLPAFHSFYALHLSCVLAAGLDAVACSDSCRRPLARNSCAAIHQRSPPSCSL